VHQVRACLPQPAVCSPRCRVFGTPLCEAAESSSAIICEQPGSRRVRRNFWWRLPVNGGGFPEVSVGMSRRLVACWWKSAASQSGVSNARSERIVQRGGAEKYASVDLGEDGGANPPRSDKCTSSRAHPGPKSGGTNGIASGERHRCVWVCGVYVCQHPPRQPADH